MERLSEKEWKECDLSTVYDFDLAKGDIQLKKALPGHTPLVSAGFSDNGVVGFIETDTSSDVFSGNKLTIDMFGQPFYQPAPFQSVSHGRVNILSGGCISDAANMFIVPCVKAGTASKYSYNQMCSQKRLQRQKVMLPVDDKGNPDYVYMTLYSTEVRKGMLMRYKNFIAGQLSQLEHKDIPVLDEKEWGHFLIPDVFPNIQRGKRLKNADHVPGIIPYVSSTANNNGVDDYVKATTGTRSFSDCISLANSGSVGTAFYEPFEFVASDHVTSLKREGMSKFVYLFLTTTIERQGSNFNFNREINDARIKKMQVMLPVSDDGKPDYKYMEQYAKNMMLRKYEQYLDFLKEGDATNGC